MKANPSICLQIDQIEYGNFEWKSVIAFGVFKELRNTAKKTEILGHFYKHFPRFTPVEAVKEGTTIEHIVVFRLEIKRLTGVSETYLSEVTKEVLAK